MPKAKDVLVLVVLSIVFDSINKCKNMGFNHSFYHDDELLKTTFIASCSKLDQKLENWKSLPRTKGTSKQWQLK